MCLCLIKVVIVYIVVYETSEVSFSPHLEGMVRMLRESLIGHAVSRLVLMVLSYM